MAKPFPIILVDFGAIRILPFTLANDERSRLSDVHRGSRL